MGNYPIVIHRIEDTSNSFYYYVYCPDFGHSACSATGDTLDEALDTLKDVYQFCIEYYKEKNLPLPTVTKPPFL